MTEEEWEKKWQALVDRAQKIQYEKNKPWAMTATGASASCSFASIGVTGLTISATLVSLSFTAFALSFTGVWGQLVAKKLKSHNGRSKQEAKQQTARMFSNALTIGRAVAFLQEKGMEITANRLAACHME